MTSPFREIISVRGHKVLVVAQRLHGDARPPFHQPRIDGSHLLASVRGERANLLRGPNGRGMCRWCWTEVPKGRLCWCGSECLNEYLMNFDWARCRSACFQRDAGICQLCRVDTAWLSEIHSKLRGPWKDMDRFQDWRRFGQMLCGTRDTCRDWWEADHILARADGGPDHPLNLRLLCIPCHRARTRVQNSERTERRRAASAALFSP